MKLNYLITAFLLSFLGTAAGQNIGIGTTTPAAKLDISSANSGVLIPRVSLSSTATASPLTAPAASTMVYNTATAGSGATAVSPGFYYWSGAAWIRVIDNNSLGAATTVGNTSSSNNLSTTVNGVTGTVVPIINSNVLSLSGNSVSSAINGVTSNALDISAVDKNIYNTSGSLSANRTMTMAGYSLNLTGGNVGIGNTTPTVALEVGSSTAAAGSKIVAWSTDNNMGQVQVANSASAGEASIGFISGATAVGDAYASTNGNAYEWNIGAGNWGIGGNKFGFGNQAYGGVMMTLTSAGFLGIGNTSPSFLLDIASGVPVAKFGSFQPIYLMSNQPMVGFNAYWNGGFLYGASSTYAGTITFGQEVSPGGFSINTAPAGTAGTTATLSSRLAITNAGLVGIGTTSPGNGLDVQNGNIDASGYIQAGGTGGGAVLFAGTTAQNGGGSGGGASFWGRPRIGDWGQWLTIGEPNGTNGGGIMQITGSGGVYTGTSTGLTVAPTIRNTLDDGAGNIKTNGNTPIQFVQITGMGDNPTLTTFNGTSYPVASWNAAVVGMQTGGSCGSGWSNTGCVVCNVPAINGFLYWWSNNGGNWQLHIDMNTANDGCNAVQVMFVRKEISSRSNYGF